MTFLQWAGGIAATGVVMWGFGYGYYATWTDASPVGRVVLGAITVALALWATLHILEQRRQRRFAAWKLEDDRRKKGSH